VYLTKYLSDGKDGEPYDNSDSIVDSDEVYVPPKKKPVPKWVYVVVVGVAVGLGAIGYFGVLDFTEYSVTITEDPNCQFYIEEAQKLVKKNDGTNHELWSEEDRQLVLEFNEKYINECEPAVEEIAKNLDNCVIVYITIQSLIDKMEPEGDGYKLDSLPDHEQDVYNENYERYYDNRCNQIVDLIEETDKFQNFNNTR
jgi:hypothetical protein